MTDIAIRCEGLSKQYRIGEREQYKSLRDVLTTAATAPFRQLRSAMSNGNGSSRIEPQGQNSFWALDDISFEVKQGEVLGIIGRNGAGKSTLLKILSRITKPTRGHAEIFGRVGSLLEVGTGFHAELTGRENLYLNGAILGMRKAAIDRKFDEIVAFAEVEKFIDTPVKRYSSGMYVRLAFAVAAHVETEVLLVDEVLAVGDAEFQQKCLGKLQEIGVAGRTVLFVSHNMAAMRALCSEAINIDQGRLVNRGEAGKVIDTYLADSLTHSEGSQQLRDMRRFVIDSVLSFGANPSEPIMPMGPSTIRIKVQAKVDCPDLSIRAVIEDVSGVRLLGVDTWTIQRGTPCNLNELKTLDLCFRSIPLAPGSYRLRLWLVSYLYDFFDEVPTVFQFNVHAAPISGVKEHDPRIHGFITTDVTLQST